MARTLTEIYNALTASKETNTELDTLLPNPDNWSTLYTNENFNLIANTIIKGLSVSKVAVWRLIMYTVAFGIYVHEQLFDEAKTEIDALTENRVFGQLPWYVEKAKAFQLGDSLSFINNEYYGYTTIDETKQIVTQASATVSSGQIILKAAKGTVGSLEALSTSEKTALQIYFMGTTGANSEDGIAPAGTKMSIVSQAPDDLRLSINVFVDPLVIDENGYLVSDGTTKPVETAVTNYIQQLPFDAVFQLSSLIDAIQAVSGVNNAVAKYCDARYGSNPYENILDIEGQVYTAFAGYMDFGTNYDIDGYYDYPTNTIKTLNYITSG